LPSDSAKSLPEVCKRCHRSDALGKTTPAGDGTPLPIGGARKKIKHRHNDCGSRPGLRNTDAA
jgi:hypothetical protein